MFTTEDGQYTITTKKILAQEQALKDELAALDREMAMVDDECYYCGQPGRYRRDLNYRDRVCVDAPRCAGDIPEEEKSATNRDRFRDAFFSRFSDPYIGKVYCREGHLVWDRGDESRRPCPCNQKEESNG